MDVRTAPLVALLLVCKAASLPAAQTPDTTTPRVTIRVITPPPSPAEPTLTTDVPRGSLVLTELTKRSRYFSGDTLFVYSNINDTSWRYFGDAIHVSLDTLFWPFYRTLAFPHGDPQLFATYRMVLDSRHIGYLLRVPGMYEPTAIDLWIYDAVATRFLLPIRVAESWGDEGCGRTLDALFLDINADVREDLVLHQMTSCVNLETMRTESESDSLWVRTWTSNGYAAPILKNDSTLSRILNTHRSRIRR